ncbi:MAG: hypothetical protein Q8934_13270 [Bacillota bacterium]|nr:hypothetical protein [Bacillota bacterium]
MKTELIQFQNSLHEEKFPQLDEIVQQIVERYQNNYVIIAKLALESVSLLTSSEARGRELSEQGLFKRLISEMTGENNQLRYEMTDNFFKSQYVAMKTMEKLQEQNLFTFELMTTIHNKLHSFAHLIESEFIVIYDSLVSFTKKTCYEMVQLDHRVETLEKNMDLILWKSTIQYSLFNGKEYTALSLFEKVVCIINDFYHLTKGKWGIKDLMLLKSVFSDLDMPVKDSIIQGDFFRALIDQPMLIDRLFEGILINHNLENITAFESPILKGIEILKVQEAPNVKKWPIIQKHLQDSANHSIESEMNLFDFSIELLFNLLLVDEQIPIIRDESSSIIDKKIT